MVPYLEAVQEDGNDDVEQQDALQRLRKAAPSIVHGGGGRGRCERTIRLVGLFIGSAPQLPGTTLCLNIMTIFTQYSCKNILSIWDQSDSH